MSSVNMNKAGMEGAPKEEINRIYEECTRDSAFTKKEKAKEQEYIDSALVVKQRILYATPDEVRSARKTMQVAVERVRESLRFNRVVVHVGLDENIVFYSVTVILLKTKHNINTPVLFITNHSNVIFHP